MKASRCKSAAKSITTNYIFVLGVSALIFSIFVTGLVFLHFQMGIDLWFLEAHNVETAPYWGQIGDFVGGILNPLLSFCALMAVLYNLSLQREELSLARKDAIEAQRIQRDQSAIFETQNFESVFFRLLDVHAKLADGVRIGRYGNQTGKIRQGDEAFMYAVQIYYHAAINAAHAGLDTDAKAEHVRATAQRFLSDHAGGFGHYYRNMYQILKYVDGLGRTDVVAVSEWPTGSELERRLSHYRKQRDYANILRAQLSGSEVACLYLNCLSEQGAGLKYYVEKYSLLKTIGQEVRDDPALRSVYLGLAYADYEEIDHYELFNLILAKY